VPAGQAVCANVLETDISVPVIARSEATKRPRKRTRESKFDPELTVPGLLRFISFRSQ
jgi:hypothetical protein